MVKNIGLNPVANQVISMFFGSDFLKDPNRKELKNTWRNHFLSNDRVGLVKAVNGVLSRPAVTSELNKIKLPTLIMWGEEDDLTDRNKAEIMHKNIEDSVLKTIPRAGHMGPVEEPAIVNKYILAFLSNEVEQNKHNE